MQLRRAGQVWSKMRFASAQLIAYVENRLWLGMARASNAIAARIAAGLRDLPGARLLAPVEVNEIFLELPSTTMDALETDGFQFYRRSRSLARFSAASRRPRPRPTRSWQRCAATLLRWRRRAQPNSPAARATWRPARCLRSPGSCEELRNRGYPARSASDYEK
jgi:hypothetical protein